MQPQRKAISVPRDGEHATMSAARRGQAWQTCPRTSKIGGVADDARKSLILFPPLPSPLPLLCSWYGWDASKSMLAWRTKELPAVRHEELSLTMAAGSQKTRVDPARRVIGVTRGIKDGCEDKSGCVGIGPGTGHCCPLPNASLPCNQ